MEELHRRAVKKRVDERIAAAKHEEEEQKRHTVDHQHLALRDVQHDLDRRGDNLDLEERRAMQKVQAEAEKKRSIAQEKANERRRIAEKKERAVELKVRKSGERTDIDRTLRDAHTEAQQERMQAESERKRTISFIDESERQELTKIRVHFERMRSEQKHAAEKQRQRIQTDATRKYREAEVRRERVEEFFGRSEKQQKQDIDDPMNL